MAARATSFIVITLAAALQAIPSIGHAQIYGSRDASGAWVLSDFRSELADELVVDAPRAVDPLEWTAARAAAVPARAAQLSDLIREVARAQDVSPRLLHAVVAVESGFDPKAVSRKGAMGLMQLMPDTARRFKVADPFDARQNLAGGATYLTRCRPDRGDGARRPVPGDSRASEPRRTSAPDRGKLHRLNSRKARDKAASGGHSLLSVRQNRLRSASRSALTRSSSWVSCVSIGCASTRLSV